MRYKAPRRASEKAVKTVSKSTVSNPSKSSFSTQPKERIKNKSFMNNYRSNDMLAVDSDILNLRNGPGIEYEAIEILKKHALLKLIAIDGEWLQVKVIESGNYGYVNAKYVYKT
ncbi:hypothetical protein B0A75_08865 [Flavobacterium oncorhynchi]|uniref:SH3b domain-containing protein n=1 Tax=Flavobacterium oncorhynchi TaxID=728056 RepID=A0A226I296_9FLAO|nr:hypothetical protein B0A75_08865 [Flavobacterium oncorhynchi]